MDVFLNNSDLISGVKSKLRRIEPIFSADNTEFALALAVKFAIFTAHYAEFMAMTYVYELENWPTFRWVREHLADQLVALRHRQGRLIGRMEGLGFGLRSEASLNTITEDVLKSSEIEGEILDRDQVRSSIARRLGVDVGGLLPADRYVEGVIEMMLDATQKFDAPLTIDR